MGKDQYFTTIQDHSGSASSAGARRFTVFYFTLNGALILLLTAFLLLDSTGVLDPLASCPWQLIGIYCPTCGLTRAAHALLRLDLLAATRLNPCIFLLLYCVFYYEAVGFFAVLRRCGEPRRVSRLPLILLFVGLLVFFLLRNLLLFLFLIDPTGDFL